MLLEDKEIDLFIASKIGSFKHLKYHTEKSKNTKNCIENLVDVKTLEKDDAITCMIWGNQGQTDIVIAKKNQQIQTYNTEKDEMTQICTADYATGDIVGLAKYKTRLVTATSSGVVKVWSKKKEQVINTGGQLECMRGCADGDGLFATGGQENELKVWRIGEPEPVFKSKNLANDWLQLRQPVWVTDLCFLPNEGGNLVAVASRHGYVRLYDTRAQRRPVTNMAGNEKMAATCVTNSFDDRQILVGFGRGQLHQVDLRNGRLDKGFKGCIGAVTSLGVVSDPRLVVVTGLDRHLRVFDYGSKELVYSQYLTSKLTAVLVQSEASTPLRHVKEGVKEEVKKEEETMDDIFENLETVGDKTKRKLPDDAVIENGGEIKSEDEDPEEAIKKLLKSTEKKKRKIDKKKKEKKAKSLYHNA